MVVRISKAHISIGVRKQLPYVRFMNYEISKLRQSGMLDVMLKRHSFILPQCSDEENEDSYEQQVALNKVIKPFSVILTGMGIAFLILSAESFYNIFSMEPKPKKVNIVLNIGKKAVKREIVIFMPMPANNLRVLANE